MLTLFSSKLVKSENCTIADKLDYVLFRTEALDQNTQARLALVVSSNPSPTTKKKERKTTISCDNRRSVGPPLPLAIPRAQMKVFMACRYWTAYCVLHIVPYLATRDLCGSIFISLVPKLLPSFCQFLQATCFAHAYAMRWFQTSSLISLAQCHVDCTLCQDAILSLNSQCIFLLVVLSELLRYSNSH